MIYFISRRLNLASLIKQSLIDINPFVFCHNFSNFILKICTIIASSISILKMFINEPNNFDLKISIFLWISIIFTNFIDNLILSVRNIQKRYINKLYKKQIKQQINQHIRYNLYSFSSKEIKQKKIVNKFIAEFFSIMSSVISIFVLITIYILIFKIKLTINFLKIIFILACLMSININRLLLIVNIISTYKLYKFKIIIINEDVIEYIGKYKNLVLSKKSLINSSIISIKIDLIDDLKIQKNQLLNNNFDTINLIKNKYPDIYFNILNIFDISTQINYTKGALIIFNIMSDITRYFVIFSVILADAFPILSHINIMKLNQITLINSLIIFNNIIIIFYILYLVVIQHINKKNNLLIYGFSSILLTLAGIKSLANYIVT